MYTSAFNPSRAKHQNITIGVSFGATRELAFLRASKDDNDKPCRLYFPQTNNGVFTFGRDVNIHWKHGINAVSAEEQPLQENKGRISIVLWGKVQHCIDEEGSPPLLGADGQGPHANNDKNKYHKRNNNNRNRRRNNNHDIAPVKNRSNNNQSIPSEN